ncbi:MAG: glycosyltransferase [Gemmatimonadaceae bacterium]
MTVPVALLAALPWVLAPLAVVLRARHSQSLDDWSEVVPPPVPRVSVIIPARNEARNIERCVLSVLTTTHPDVEVIVVDDHSTDETAGIARAIALSDSRLRVVTSEPLPEGWFGKQWACAAGAAQATGNVLLFTDADTVHAPDLVARSVNAMRARGAELLSVAGAQTLGTFWERVVQPQLFGLIVARYGGTERVSQARRPSDAIANGQSIFITRAAYDASGGHAAVRDKVAEDLALAQRFVRQRRRLALVTGLDQLNTRMYTSLAETVRGWQKNIYAGGRDAMPEGRWSRALFPVALLGAPLMALVPPVVLVAGLAGFTATATLLWAVVAVGFSILFWAGVYVFLKLPIWYAFAYPLGLLVLLYIAVTALARGPRVTWKGRAYRVT